MASYLSKIDLETTGNRYDVTPLFADPDAFGQLVEDLADPFEHASLNLVACLDALGFILGTALARRLGVGILPVRKGGKLPVATDGETVRDYSGEVKRLEIRTDILSPGDRVLMVDEWIETGAQVLAAARLIEGRGGIVVGIAAIQMDENEQTAAIRKAFQTHTVWTDPPWS